MLTKCVECGHSVSDRASACPQCGGPMKTKPITVGAKITLVLDIAMVCLGLITLTQAVTDNAAILGLVVFLLGTVDLVWTTKIRRWWTNG